MKRMQSVEGYIAYRICIKALGKVPVRWKYTCQSLRQGKSDRVCLLSRWDTSGAQFRAEAASLSRGLPYILGWKNGLLFAT